MSSIDPTRNPGQDALTDARQALQICNACRYCEGYCAVFPAMTQRRAFSDVDLDYLANLCHGCRGCYYSCQYAPPHPFHLNLPRVLAEVRGNSYAKYAWPGPLARLFEHNGLVVSLAVSLSLGLVLALTVLLQDTGVLFAPQRGPGSFYAVIPHGVMVAVAGTTFGFAVLALIMGFLRFWTGTGGSLRQLVDPRALGKAVSDIATLRNLGGGAEGEGCTYPDEAFSNKRRWLHHFMMYGFLLCFAATCVGTIYDYGFGWVAPYSWYSLPVVMGTIGGMGLLIGPGGLLALKFVADPEPGVRRQLGMDVALLALLFLVSLTGLVLLVFRETPAMGILLAIHLGFVLGLFLTLPYGKFVHSIYRGAALLKAALERP
ncbi:tricarballylate utilization 4Fe-4S protein TcuB [Rhodospirillum sp. A1_3_36]|uniref:tricarballylate utilization 4Fe-4S protein TcuB n=1 Tax=Rhodospirillum sp. A1_3_36 TaxID=3391666 RepID=UPI0039A6BEF4